VEVVASLSQGRTAAAQCGLFTYKSVPVIFEPPCICEINVCPKFVGVLTIYFPTYHISYSYMQAISIKYYDPTFLCFRI